MRYSELNLPRVLSLLEKLVETGDSEASTSIGNNYNEICSVLYDEFLSQEKRIVYLPKLIRRYIDYVTHEVFSSPYKKPEDKRILDAGCGTGNEYNTLNNWYNMVGVDISPSMLKVAQEKTPEGVFVQGNLLERDLFEENSFDGIVSLFAPIFYEANYEEILLNFHYWLKKDNFLLIDVSNPKILDRNWKQETKTIHLGPYKIEHSGCWKYGNEYHEKILINDTYSFYNNHRMYYPPPKQFKEQVEKIGFQIVDVIDEAIIDDNGELFYALRKRG